MWSPVVHHEPNARSVPSSRCKHAVSLNPQTNHIYILGGRNGNIPLKDFWIFSIESGRWSCLSGRSGTPVNLQEHSMNYFDDKLYVFGGVFLPSNECPLWIYETQQGKWNQWKNVNKTKSQGESWPKSRRAHTAVVFNQALLVYGGYQDMRGSLSELWQFSFESSEWKLIHGNEAKKANQVIPAPRHRHSAIVYDEGMWVYGGMTDLQERSDLWRLDLVSKQWTVVKSKLGPGPLHSHSAVRLHSFMMIIGGEKQGCLSNEVWRFHFASETWERLETCEPRPSARTQLAAVTFNVPLFTAKSRAAGLRSKMSSSAAVECSTVSATAAKVRTAANKARGPIFGLRNRGYHLVNGLTGQSCVDDDQQDEDIDDVNTTNPLRHASVYPRENSRLTAPVPCWMSKSSTYSLLSNTSTDSLIQPDEGESSQGSPCYLKADETAHKIRSESVHNFGNSSANQNRSITGLPRSFTANRVNPFDSSNHDPDQGLDPSHALRYPRVRREETLTSDYCSEIHDSAISVHGIPNPLYDTSFHSCANETNDHREFAVALNRSVADMAANANRSNHLGKEIWSHLIRFASENEQVDRWNQTMELAGEATDRCIQLMEDDWSILILGGREEGHATGFDRPLSIWMLRL